MYHLIVNHFPVPLVFHTIPKRTTRTQLFLHCCDVWQLQGIVFSQNLIERQLHLGFTSLLSAKCQSEKYRALPLSNRHPWVLVQKIDLLCWFIEIPTSSLPCYYSYQLGGITPRISCVAMVSVRCSLHQ